MIHPGPGLRFNGISTPNSQRESQQRYLATGEKLPETLWAFLGDETPEAQELAGDSMVKGVWNAQVARGPPGSTAKIK